MSERDFLPPGRSDPAGMGSGADFNPAAPSLEPTAGALLRQARQAQGLHLAAMAASLKVPVEKLEALEQDRFDLLLDAVFVRALASGVCRLLKLDPNPILQRLPVQEAAKAVPQNRGLNEPFRPRSGAGSSWAQLSKPVIFIGLALLLGAAVLVFLPTIQKETAGKPPSQESSSQGPVIEHSSPGTPSMVQEPVSNSAPTVPENPAAQSPVTPPGPVSPSSAPGASAPAAAPPASASVSGQPAGSAMADSVVTFAARESSWVKVTDAKSAIVLARMLGSGESVSVSGVLPLSVLVGRAHVMQVQVRGQALDLKALAKNDVARFEVK